MKILSIDTETHLIQPGQIFPRLVCVTLSDGIGADILDRRDGLARFREIIVNPDIILVGHNIAYDLGIFAAEDESLLPLIFAAYDADRIRDTGIRQMLLDIAQGVFKYELDEDGKATKHKYALADLVQRHFGRYLQKADTYRLRYNELDGIPIAEWPAEARDYAITDAVETLEVHDAQTLQVQQEGLQSDAVPDESRQARYAWSLHLEAGWGVRTDGPPVAALRATLEAERDAAMAELTKSGVVRPNGSKDMKKISALIEADFAARGMEPPRTPKGAVKTGKEVLQQTSHSDLLILADAAEGMKLLSTYVPVLERGIHYPITSRPNVLVDSGRTSWSKPNLQNPPRKGGIRECFIPRDGWVYCSIDYDTIELKALAQTCLELPGIGWSEMANALRRGEDLHLALAADMLGITYADAKAREAAGDPEIDQARQSAKAANFGFPGGMGVDKFLWAQRDLIKKLSWKYESPEEWGARLRNAWLNKWPEMREYFKNASRLTQPSAECRMVHPYSGRVRGGLDYCSAANSYFQGRTADGAKLAQYRLTRECYIGAAPLRGNRPVIFLHDEIISELWEPISHEAALAKCEIMIKAMSEVIPDIPITAKPVLMRRWYKGAKPVYVDGRLVPGKPVKDERGKVTWQPDLRT